jgi:hypothetical protein
LVLVEQKTTAVHVSLGKIAINATKNFLNKANFRGEKNSL